MRVYVYKAASSWGALKSYSFDTPNSLKRLWTQFGMIVHGKYKLSSMNVHEAALN